MEPIDILDEKTGEKTGEVRSIDDVHVFGLWHRSSRVWIINSKKEILLQHRDKSSMEYPNMWDVSAGGHITAGDTSLDTAINEVKEELGLDINSSDVKLVKILTKKDVSKNGNYIDNSFEDIYITRKDLEIDSLKMQEGEVQNLKWFSFSEFDEMVKSRNTELVPHFEEYEFVLKEIEK